jgi:hypothetical protein
MTWSPGSYDASGLAVVSIGAGRVVTLEYTSPGSACPARPLGAWTTLRARDALRTSLVPRDRGLEREHVFPSSGVDEAQHADAFDVATNKSSGGGVSWA